MEIYKLSLRKNRGIYLLLILCLCISPAKGQTYVEKAYYLIDSLNLDELGESDKHLIDSALKLYHQAKHDSDRLNSIMILTQKMVHEDWSKYNEFLYIELQEMLAGSSLTEKESLFGKKMLASVYHLFGEVALKKGDLKKANTFASQSLELAQELGFPDDIRNATLLSSNIYQEDREFEEGLKMYKLYISMRDSILNANTRKSTIVQQTIYEIEKAQLLKEQAAKEEARITAELKTRRHNFQYAIILIVLLFIFVGIASLGKITLSPRVTQAFIYLAILILFESSLVIADPYVEELANGEPGWKLLANLGIALLLFPFHTVLDKRLKKRITKNSKTKILSKP